MLKNNEANTAVEKSKISRDKESVVEIVLQTSAVVSLLFGMFFWSGNLYWAFWLRRFFIGLAGLSSLLLLAIFHREKLYNFARQRTIPLFLFITTLALLYNSRMGSALVGKPVVHPSLLSLYASVTIGLLLTTFDKQKVLKGSYYAILGWATVSCLAWILGHSSERLGFLDTQVIYAACLFAIGILIGLWLYKKALINRTMLKAGISLLVVCLILSQTRSALFILAALIILEHRVVLRRKLKLVLIFTAIVILGYIVCGGYFSRLTSYSYLTKSVEYRLNLIQASLPKPAKIVTGSGVGSINNNIRAHGNSYPLLANDVKRGVQFESSHNYFADLLVERGAIVLIVFIYILHEALKSRSQLSSGDALLRSTLAFMVLYVAVNNINIQMEVIIWVCIIFSIKEQYEYSLAKKNH